MKVRDLMVTDVSICRTSDNLAEVAAIMWNRRCGALPVLDDGGNVLSLITDRDICIALGTRNVRASDLRVSDVALPRVFLCAPELDIRSALEIMVSQNIRRLPVVDKSLKLVVILSINDMVKACEKHPSKSGLPYSAVMDGLKAILAGRSRGLEHPPAEVVAARA